MHDSNTRVESVRMVRIGRRLGAPWLQHPRFSSTVYGFTLDRPMLLSFTRVWRRKDFAIDTLKILWREHTFTTTVKKCRKMFRRAEYLPRKRRWSIFHGETPGQSSRHGVCLARLRIWRIMTHAHYMDSAGNNHSTRNYTRDRRRTRLSTSFVFRHCYSL